MEISLSGIEEDYSRQETLTYERIDPIIVRRFLRDMFIQDGYDEKLVNEYLETPDIIEFINLLVRQIERGEVPNFKPKGFHP